MPLFNKFTPLNQDTLLYAKIQQLASKVHYPLQSVLIMDGSRRSSHGNAFLYGFGSNKRIVLFDTLLEQMEGKEDCIVSVLCHELGHWYYGHVTWMLVPTLFQLCGICFGARTVIFDPNMYGEFGFDDQNPLVGLDLFAQVFLNPICTLTGYLLCYVCRHFEFQADTFAVENDFGEELRHALVLVSKESKKILNPDPLYSALSHTHPPIVERIAAIDAQMLKRTKQAT
ncbi:STE24 endopeptidase [Strigomonas culicis]|nr:STE24 endopeptidase [Strigomonas culicis]|eukprot:EPY36895.1 STE24 endopeptidase [Strigomonas culicis]